MRWVISTAAFFTPLLLIIALAGTCSTPVAPPAIGGRAYAELRTWVDGHLDILDHYAARPGVKASAAIPHLALQRFDRLGCDPSGNPWYRLGDHPEGITCGVLRLNSTLPAAPDGTSGPIRLFTLSGGWSYWEAGRPRPQPRP